MTRTFNRFQDIADEAGLSRILAGVHTRIDHVAGQKMGRQVAGFVLDEDHGLVVAGGGTRVTPAGAAAANHDERRGAQRFQGS